MNYLQARWAEGRLRQFKALVHEYWGAQKAGPQEASALRERMAVAASEARIAAALLEIDSTFTSFPAPMFAGSAPVLPISAFDLAMDRGLGHGVISRELLLNFLDDAITRARWRKKLLLIRLVSPWYWVIDAPALVLRVPFLVLRGAGLPASVEESVWAHIIKVAMLLLGAWAAMRFGLKVSASDIVGLVK